MSEAKTTHETALERRNMLRASGAALVAGAGFAAPAAAQSIDRLSSATRNVA